MRSAMDRVKACMTECGVDWSELAMLSNIAPSRLVDLHTGRQGQMTLWECQAIARALQTPLDFLFADHASDLTAADIFREREVAKLIREIGPAEVIVILTNPNVQRKRRKTCSCGSSSD